MRAAKFPASEEAGYSRDYSSRDFFRESQVAVTGLPDSWFSLWSLCPLC